MINVKAQITKDIPSHNDKKYDLEERTATLGEKIIDFAKTLPRNEITLPLISQLIRSGTSIGANYLEADTANTKKDFLYKISLSRKEAKETRHWLRMIAHAVPDEKGPAHTLSQEAKELVLIFSAILKS